MVTKAGKNVTEMVIQRMTDGPRPSNRTSSGVSATRGMVCVTRAIGMKPRTMAGLATEAMASANAKRMPAAMPRNVRGKVCESAVSNFACAGAADGARNR